MSRQKRPSPILGAASAMIGHASESLITRGSRFRHTFEVRVDSIGPDPDQARKVFNDAEIAELAGTMDDRGQLQPILIRRNPDAAGRWLIVAGERRWRAARRLRWPAMLAIEHDGDAEVVSLLENLQRVDLSAVEEARGVRRLIDGKGWSQDQAAAALGKSKSDVSSTLRILTLPEDLLTAVLNGQLSLHKTTLAELARVREGGTRDQLVALAWRGALTVRAIRAAQTEEPAGGAPPETPAPVDADPPRLSLRSLDRVADTLRAYAAAGQPIPEQGRARLETLRQEIDRLLARG